MWTGGSVPGPGNGDSSLTVGMDVTALLHPASGIGRYTEGLLTALLGLPTPPRIVPYVHHSKGRISHLPGDLVARGFPSLLPRRILHGAWRAFGWPPIEDLLGAVDVFHRSDWVHPPTRRAALVSTIHDLCPLIRPDWYAPEISEIHRRNAEAVAQDAAVVLTVSEFTRREFLKRFADVPEDRVRTVHSGLGEGFEPPDPQVARERVGALGLRSPYVLHVGTREKRKNLLGLVEIFAHLARKNGSVDLVLAGALPWDEAREVHGVEAWAGSEVEKSIQKHGLSGRTRVLGTVSSSDLVALYGGAAAFVFPSLCEGFGFPVLEAMACGTPVIASDRGAIPEIVAGAGILADPEGPAEFAEKVLQVLQDEELRRDLRGKGLDRAQVFTWSAAAVRTLDAYGLACEGSLAE